LLTLPVWGRAVTALPVRRHDDRVHTLLMSGPRVRGHPTRSSARTATNAHGFLTIGRYPSEWIG
jgi:hypothetical protein